MMSKSRKIIRYFNKLGSENPRAALFFYTCVMFLLAAVIVLARNLCADDAWMYIRYADHLISDHTFSWNRDGPHTLGITSLLHLLFVTLLRLDGFDMDLSLKLSVLFAFTALLFSASILYYKYDRSLYNVSYFVVTMLYLVVSRPVQTHLSSGMDTILSVYANFLLYYFASELLKEIDEEHLVKKKLFIYYFLISLISILVRPDSAILVFGYFVVLYLLAKREFRTILRTMALYFVLVCIGGVVILLAYFGDPLPLPFYVKGMVVYKDLANIYNDIPGIIFYKFIIFISPIILINMIFRQKLKSYILFLPPFGAYIYYTFNITQIMAYEMRFLFPLLGPLLMFTIISLGYETSGENNNVNFSAVTSVNGTNVISRFIIRLTEYYNNGISGAIIILVCFSSGVIIFYNTNYNPYGDLKKQRELYVSLTENITTIPEDMIIASTEHGFLGAKNVKKKIIDMSGLHDHILSRGFSAEYVFSIRPDLVMMPYPIYKGMIREIERYKLFKSDYIYVRRMDRGIEFGIAIRKKSPYCLEIAEVVKNSFESTKVKGKERYWKYIKSMGESCDTE